MDIWKLKGGLQDIHDYIAQDNPAAAQRVVSQIYKKTAIPAKENLL